MVDLTDLDSPVLVRAPRSFRQFLAVLALASVVAAPSVSQSIKLEHKSVEVWLPQQTIRGVVNGDMNAGTVTIGSREYPFDIENSEFTVDVDLDEGPNEVVACAEAICSDAATWTLAYELRPEVYAWADVEGRSVTLHGAVLDSPNGEVESFAWSQDPSNAAAFSLASPTDSVATFSVPDDAPAGEYYFDLVVRDATGRAGKARTFVTVDSSGIAAFDIWSDHASWVDRAVVYEVTPYIFEGNGTWRDVTTRLGEMAGLGVNTLWIQPVFEAQMEGPSTSGQGYGITNYLQLRSDLGTEQDLRELVRSAKEDHGMRVLFDFVPNHTSIEHRYAQDVLARGAASHYYDFYLTEPDDAPYSRHYRLDREPFIYYFWDRLVIIDWRNPEVYRWMMEAGRHWIEEFDIDGYRIDAVWGVNARTPEAMQKWRFDLKRVKPEILLLGEDKATWSSSFDKRFDAAYDWYPEEGWVSHWTWQTDYSATQNHTIFNTEPVAARSERLRDALTNRGDGWHPDAKVFRFLQNNDTFPFIKSHGLKRTKMAATLLFSLPGIPMIYNGQEIGHDRHPYRTRQIFDPGTSIREQDPYGLYEHYHHLSALRTTYPVFYSDTFEELDLAPARPADHTFAFRRRDGDEHLVTVVNMAEEAVRVRLELPTTAMGFSDDRTYYLTDLFTGEAQSLSGNALRFPVLNVPGYSTRVFILGNEAVQIPTNREEVESPVQFTLHQNYPNPFNHSTTIAYDVPSDGRVLLRIVDVLGREVATLVDGVVAAGRHEVQFDGRNLASGVYAYRLEVGDQLISKQMILLK